MKNNKINFTCLAGITIGALLFAACEKKTGYTITKTTDDTETQSIVAADELNVNYEFDQAINEVLLASTISRIVSGDTSAFPPGNVLYSTLSHAVIDTSQSASGIVNITFFGKNADDTKGRTGKIQIKLPVDNGHVIPWKTKGVIATLTFDQFEILVLATNRQLWQSGTCSITNISGGLLKKAKDLALLPGDSLIDKLSGQITFTYNDNIAVIQTWDWHFNQLRSFSLSDTTVIASISNTTIPIIQSISGLFILSNPISGSKAINGIKEPILIIYGVNEQGSIVTEGDPYGYKIVWNNSAGERTQTVVSY
jgi:hypothetical protein